MVSGPYHRQLDLLVNHHHYHVQSKDLPKAAVFKVPKARYFSKDGSQTNISPSRIMLFYQLMRDLSTYASLLFDIVLEGIGDILCQTPFPNVCTVHVR